MELLASNFPPLNINGKNFSQVWEKNFKEADSVQIAVGYASNDSLLYLKKLIELNQPKAVSVCLGMAYFDGLSRSQFQAMELFSEFVESNSIGFVRFVRSFPFHGKVFLFENENKVRSSLIGSSNLSNIVPLTGMQQRNYEIDVEIEDSEINLQVKNMIHILTSQASVSFQENKQLINVYQNPNSLLNDRSDVVKVTSDFTAELRKMLTSSSFEIPLKTTSKSNLNVFFGEGRTNSQGFTKPRHWYEVELIVDSNVQKSNSEYPANQDFWVITDDGYKFVCRTSGDYGKNFRSRDDLTVLGRWIKGRLESASCLSVGEPVTNDVLAKYGRESVTLTKTTMTELDSNGVDELNVWYIDFRV